MLAILVIYSIGRYFFKLAKNHGKSKWVYVILGIVSYYFPIFIIGLIIGIWSIFDEETFMWIEDSNFTIINYGCMLIGALSAFVFYKLLSKKWQNKPQNFTEIEEIGKNERV